MSLLLRVLAASAVLSLAGCLLTNELGLKPPGAISGAELRNEAGETALLGFQLSVSGYCNRFSAGRSTCASEVRDGKSAGSFLALALTPDYSGIDPGAFYTGESANECLSNILLQMLLLPNLYLQAEDGPTSSGSITLDHPTDSVRNAALFAVVMAGSTCESVLEAPGPLLYLGGDLGF